MALERKHYIGTLTGAVVALAAGTAAHEGYLPHWEGRVKATQVAVHQSFDPKGVITVCSGITNHDIKTLKAGDVYTLAMCDDAMAAALPKYNAMLASCLPKDFMVGTHQHVAMLSFVYNVGQGHFCNSSVGREFRAGHREAGCRNMGKFTRAAGRELKGLHNRRYDKFWGEIAWCLTDDAIEAAPEAAPTVTQEVKTDKPVAVQPPAPEPKVDTRPWWKRLLGLGK
jgi:lysozyme